MSYEVIFLKFDDERFLVFFLVLLFLHIQHLLAILHRLVSDENRSLRTEPTACARDNDKREDEKEEKDDDDDDEEEKMMMMMMERKR